MKDQKEKDEKPTKMVTPADLFGEVTEKGRYEPPKEKEDGREKEPTKH